MRDVYHEDLATLSGRLVEMTRLVRLAIAQASAALLDADLRLAEEVISGDVQVDKIRTEIEDSVFDLMACQQPVAGDPRRQAAVPRGARQGYQPVSADQPG